MRAELVGSVVAPQEDDSAHQELLENLATLRNMAPEESPPIREACLHILLDLLKVAGGNGLEACEPDQLRLETAPPTLPRLNPVKEWLEVAALGHRRGEPGEFLPQDPELRLEGGPARDHRVRGDVQLFNGPAHGAPDNLYIAPRRPAIL